MSIKVLVIGLDGATWDLIMPSAEQGKLPTFRKLMDNGVWGELESTIPPWTIPAWESMSTGKSPDGLGFATFMVKEGYRFVPYISRFRSHPQIWDILSENGYKVIAANLPNICEPEEVNGNIVCGWLYRDRKNLTYPKELIDEINECCDGYMVDIVDVDLQKAKIVGFPSDKSYFTEVERMLKKRALAFKYLLEKEWNFAFLVFSTLDRVQHRTWNKDILLDIHKKIDEEIAKLLESTDDKTNVILASDHGFGKKDHSFNVNEWLIREGYLRINSGGLGSSLLMMISNRIANHETLRRSAARLVRLLPTKSRGFIATRTSSRSFESLDIDWRNTKAFAYGPSGDVYVNLKGREPEGAVDIEDYGKITNQIVEGLKSLRHPKTGEILAVKAFTKEEVYDGPLEDNKPDIVILPTDGGIESISPWGAESVFAPCSGGEHRLNGIFVACGPEIKKGQEIQGARIYDITPTILHMFGLPIPADTDGRVLKEIFEEGSEPARREITYQEAEAEDEKERIREKIKKLKPFP